MKKTLLLALVLAAAFLFIGCSDPVAEEFTDFLNVQMLDVNANYNAITEELGKWDSLETDAEWMASIKDVLIPKCDETLEMLGKIELQTEEVKEIKAKFTKIIELYKEGFAKILSGIESVDEAVMMEGNSKLEEGLIAVDEYNAALEALAALSGYEIEY